MSTSTQNAIVPETVPCGVANVGPERVFSSRLPSFLFLLLFPELTGHGGKSLTLGCGIVEPSVPGICFCLSIVGSCPTPAKNMVWACPPPSRKFLSFASSKPNGQYSRPPVCPPTAWLRVSCFLFLRVNAVWISLPRGRKLLFNWMEY